MKEEWKDLYLDGIFLNKQVSNLGYVRNKAGIMSLSDNGAGYLSVHLTSIKVGGKCKERREYIHRLVAKYFIPNPQNLAQVNHKDCNKANNRVDNLEWISSSDNILHAHASGRMVERTTNAMIVCLTEDEVVDCYTSVILGGKGVNETAKRLGKPRTTISSIINKRSRRLITDKLDAMWNDPDNSICFVNT